MSTNSKGSREIDHNIAVVASIAEHWNDMDRARLQKTREPDYYVPRTMDQDDAKAWLRQKCIELGADVPEWMQERSER